MTNAEPTTCIAQLIAQQQQALGLSGAATIQCEVNRYDLPEQNAVLLVHLNLDVFAALVKL